MPNKEQIKETAETLLSRWALSEYEVQDLFQKAIDIGYWKHFLPTMGVLDDLQSLDHLEGAAFSSEQEAWTLAHLARHGYFQMPPIPASDVTARMCASVGALRSAGWPAVFTYVFDEFWTVWRTPSMVRLLSCLLGTGYLQTSGVWTYRVDPRQRASGWPPHVDSPDAERISVWIPLTEATIHNGCMYVIPQDRIPPGLPASYSDWTSISAQELNTLLHNVTPLPADVGSVLGWNNRLIHWGGRTMDLAACPRVSVAAEFLHARTRPHRTELPVFDVNLPSFPLRLLVIGQAILSYERFEPLMRRYRGLATKLIEWASSEARG